MNLDKVLKILANENRLNMLQWLSDPEKYFPELVGDLRGDLHLGVCIGLIEKKSHLSQSTISQYMSQLELVGLVTSQKSGKWTHYKRNEQALNDLMSAFKAKLHLGKVK
jgi:ArsR family transcriptional regulator